MTLDLTTCIGRRVVVRYRLPGGGYSDALGDLIAADADQVTIQTRRGPITLTTPEIAIAKLVPPPPTRLEPQHDQPPV